MVLLFTGAPGYLETQNNPEISLGGLISSSMIPNGTVDEILGSISEKQMIDGGREVKAFALLNNTGNVINAPKLFYTNDSSEPISNIRMSVVVVGEDTVCGTFFMEQIANSGQLPINASFKDNRGENNSIVMPNIPDGGYIGIWIERTINTGRSGGGPNGLMSCDNMYQRHIADPVNQIQEIDTVADVADSLNGRYFLLTTPNGRFYIWYNTGAGIDPNIVGREGIEISINTNDTAITVANSTQLQLQTILNFRGEINTTVAGNKVTIENLYAGPVQGIDISTSGFTTSIVTAGLTNQLEKEETINLFIKY